MNERCPICHQLLAGRAIRCDDCNRIVCMDCIILTAELDVLCPGCMKDRLTERLFRRLAVPAPVEAT